MGGRGEGQDARRRLSDIVASTLACRNKPTLEGRERIPTHQPRSTDYERGRRKGLTFGVTQVLKLAVLLWRKKLRHHLILIAPIDIGHSSCANKPHPVC